jgi:hypothetical protein
MHVRTDAKCESELAAGGSCDLAKAASAIDDAAAKAREIVTKSCQDIDLSGLTAGGCVTNEDGSANDLDAILGCLEGGHRELAEGLVGDEFGASLLTRCCVTGVCTKTNSTNCATIGVNVGPGSCRPNPCGS